MALRAAEVEVIQVFEPYVEYALEGSAGHIWYAAADRGLVTYTSLYTTQACLARCPHDLLQMTRALYRTLNWIANHEAAELADRVADYFPDLARQTLTHALARYKTLGVWNRTPMLAPEGFAGLEAACLSGGFIQQGVPYARCVDMRFAKQVIQEAFRGVGP
ncbi:hypothetical protein NKDENANG_04145 [Candidatus Entotheonellaceae bacterium PAL068K]